MTARHKLLGCRLNGSPASWASTYQNDFFGVGNYPDGWDPLGGRLDDIRACVGMMALHHLGYKTPVDLEDFLNRGFDVVVDYFCGDWWKADKAYAAAMDKTRKNRRNLEWFDAFANGLLLGLLSERWDDVAKVCGWIDADLPAAYFHMDVEEELVHAYKSVAAALRPEPMPGLESVEARIRKCRKPRPRLLYQAWEAARAGDQSAFDAAFVNSSQHFAANYGSGDIAIEWVAPHQSVVAMAAQRLGLKLPELPPKLEAAVMTRQSLGLSSQPARRSGPTGKSGRAKDRARS